MNNLEIVEVGGLKFYTRTGTSDRKGIDEVVAGKGYKRSKPFSFVPEVGETWIDLGANVGAFSVWALAHGAKEVIAFEPDPESAQMCEMNLRAQELKPYQSFKVHQLAMVADERESATLYQNTAKGNVWRNSIERPWRGGESVTVKCVSMAKRMEAEVGPVNLKIDIEGTEMPIIEMLVAHPEYMKKINKMAFEWSFDVDPSLIRFRNVMNKLREYFPNVAPGNMYEAEDVWPASWFPPCKTIFCKK